MTDNRRRLVLCSNRLCLWRRRWGICRQLRRGGSGVERGGDACVALGATARVPNRHQPKKSPSTSVGARGGERGGGGHPWWPAQGGRHTARRGPPPTGDPKGRPRPARPPPASTI